MASKVLPREANYFLTMVLLMVTYCILSSFLIADTDNLARCHCCFPSQVTYGEAGGREEDGERSPDRGEREAAANENVRDRKAI